MLLHQIVPITLPTDTIPKIERAQEEISMLKTLPLDELISKLVSSMVNFAIHLAVAVVVFYVGRFIIRKLYKVVHALMIHRQIDRSLTTFVLSLVRIVLYFILIVTVIGILGLETSSFLAIFASAGVAIGMALSGTLQNFAGGVLILLLKPYKIGDYIEVAGYAGTVKEIQIFHTIIVTFDNKAIILPNGQLSTGSINNWSHEAFRRVDWALSISYGDDFDKARKVILDILLADDRVVKEYIEDFISAHPEATDCDDTHGGDCPEQADAPEHLSWWQRLSHRRRKAINSRIEALQQQHRAKVEAYAPRVSRKPTVYLKTMADSSIVVSARAWTRTKDYWAVYYQMNELFYKALPEAGLTFPFPQLDVHLQGGEADAPKRE